MPTLHAEAGYVFEMVMFDCRERRHVHVRGRGKGGAKVWMEPVIEIASSGGYNAPESRQIQRIIGANLAGIIARWDEGMRSRGPGRTGVMTRSPVVRDVRVDDALITFVLADGRVVGAPTTWSRRLARATAAERARFEIEPEGLIVAWPDVDEHIGVWTLLGVSEEDAIAAAELKVVQPA